MGLVTGVGLGFGFLKAVPMVLVGRLQVLEWTLFLFIDSPKRVILMSIAESDFL